MIMLRVNQIIALGEVIPTSIILLCYINVIYINTRLFQNKISGSTFQKYFSCLPLCTILAEQWPLVMKLQWILD
jgi:hypothetical protein